MRVSNLVPLLALFTSVFAASLSVREGCEEVGSEICEETQFPSPTVTVDLVERAPVTNAERFARGLPPNPPKRKHRGHHGPSRTHTCSPSPLPPVTYHGVIQVFSGDVSLGYVAEDPNYWTPLLTPDILSAWAVSFSLPSGATSGSTLDLAIAGTYPLLGVVVGRDSTSSDFAPGSFNYGYVAKITNPTPPNSVPLSGPGFFVDSTGLDKQSETAIWSVDLLTGALSVQWVNTDSTKPSTIVFIQSNHVYVGGDPAAFQSRFPAPVVPVTLKFIPA